MFKEIAQIGSMLKQAQSLSGKLQEAQQRLAATQFVGAADDGSVRIELSGHGQVTDCRIATELLTPNRKSDVEARVVAAVNAALIQLKQRTASEMGEVTGGLDLGALGNTLGLMPKS